MSQRIKWMAASVCLASLVMSGSSMAGGVCEVSGSAGFGPDAPGQSAFACGYEAVASGGGSTAVGTGAGRTNTGTQNVAVGFLAGSGVPGSRNTATGAGVGGPFGLDAGAGSFVEGNDNSAYGFVAGRFVSGDDNSAFGSQAGQHVTGSGNSAFGAGAGGNVNGHNNIAIGQGAGNDISASNTISIGLNATAGHENAVAIGAGVATTRNDQVAIGTDNSTYTLAGVASAASTAAQSGPTYLLTTDMEGNLAASTISGKQIQDTIVGLHRLSGEIDETRTEARQGIAAAIAMANAPMPSQVGKTSWATNVGHFKGSTAFGGSLTHRFDLDVPMAFSAGYSYGGGTSHAFRVGLMGEF